MVAVLDASQRRPPKRQLLPRDVRPTRRSTRSRRRPVRGARGAGEPDREDSDLNVVASTARTPTFSWPTTTRERPRQTVAWASGPTGMHAWLDLPRAGCRGPVVSIASIRGPRRAPEASSCWPATCGFAVAREALLGQFEVGNRELVPGGGPAVRCRRLVGRGRAPSRSCSSPTTSRAARGAVRIRQPGDRRRPLDAEVDAIAARVARFDHEAIARTKANVDAGDAACRR
jgi:hypothetical protein